MTYTKTHPILGRAFLIRIPSELNERVEDDGFEKLRQKKYLFRKAGPDDVVEYALILEQGQQRSNVITCIINNVFQNLSTEEAYCIRSNVKALTVNGTLEGFDVPDTFKLEEYVTRAKPVRLQNKRKLCRAQGCWLYAVHCESGVWKMEVLSTCWVVYDNTVAAIHPELYFFVDSAPSATKKGTNASNYV